MRNIVIVMILLSAQAAAAQPPDPDRPRRLTVGISNVHEYTVFGGGRRNPVLLGLHAGWRLTDRIGLHTDIAQHRENHGFDEYLGGERIRTRRWWMAGTTFHFNDRGRLRPHLLTGFEMLVERDNTCDLLRRIRPGEPCEDFPGRRPGVNGGLGVDIPFGSRFFARFQYLTSAAYYEKMLVISHKARLTLGIGF